MKYFAVMYDGRLEPVVDVSKSRDGSTIYFTVGKAKFKYTPTIRDFDKLHGGVLPCNQFYIWLSHKWSNTRLVEYLLALDEKENEELNYFQSTDFNAGMLYSAIEKKTVTMLKETDEHSTSGAYHIPNIQVVPKGCSCVDDSKVIEATIKSATEHFKAVYGKTLELDIYAWQRVKQYCVFFYRITRKEIHKEMTIAEIEEALGYKIKVVGDK